jgi:hypothetical protein
VDALDEVRVTRVLLLCNGCVCDLRTEVVGDVEDVAVVLAVRKTPDEDFVDEDTWRLDTDDGGKRLEGAKVTEAFALCFVTRFGADEVAGGAGRSEAGMGFCDGTERREDWDARERGRTMLDTLQ